MGAVYHTAPLAVQAEVAWDFLDRYTRSEVHVFSSCTSERQVGDYRVVTIVNGDEVWEENVTVDPEHMRAVYRIPGLQGSVHHQAEMRVVNDADGKTSLVWVTDFLPHSIVEEVRDTYEVLFEELVAAVNGHRL